MKPDLERAKRLLPQQIAACVAVAASAAAVIMTADSPGFGTFVGVIIALGCLTSILLTYLGVHAEGLWMPVAGLALACAALRHAEIRLVEFFYPLEVATDGDLLLAMSIAWIGVARCFGLTRPRSASFSLVPSIAPFGLVGALNLSPGVLVSFFVFLFAAVFVLGHERLLQEEDRLRAAGSAGLPARSRIHSQLVAASVLLIAVIVVAALSGTTLHEVMPNLATALAHQISTPGGSTPSLETLSESTDTELGVGLGPVELSHVPLMFIDAREACLWRTAVYDEYTGNGWRQSDRRRWRARTRGQPIDLRARGLVTVEGPRRILKQTVRAVTDLPEELAAAAQPIMLEPHSPGYRTQSVLVDPYGCVRLGWRQRRGTEMTVWSAISAARLEQLRDAPAEYPEWLERAYTRLPMRARAEAEGIAHRIAAGAATPYDKAVAIDDYLRGNHMYTLEGPYIPSHRDAVLEFVTRYRRGACDLFASSFVVLARAEGIPARLAVGYNVGTLDPDTREFLVHEDDAHAWAEAYFPGYGWVAFDPSQGARQERPTIWSLISIGQYWSFIVAVLKGVLAVGAALGFGLWLISAAFNIPLVTELLRYTRRRRAHDPRTRLMATYERVCGRLARAGRPRRPWETPAEYGSAIAVQCSGGSQLLTIAFDGLTRIVERGRYGRRSASQDDATAAHELATQVVEGLRALRRATGRRPLGRHGVEGELGGP